MFLKQALTFQKVGASLIVIHIAVLQYVETQQRLIVSVCFSVWIFQCSGIAFVLL